MPPFLFFSFFTDTSDRRIEELGRLLQVQRREMSCIRGLVLTQLQTDMDRSVRNETLSDGDSDANSTDKAARGEEREQSIRRTLVLDRLRPRRAAHTDDLRSPPTTSVVLNDPWGETRTLLPRACKSKRGCCSQEEAPEPE